MSNEKDNSDGGAGRRSRRITPPLGLPSPAAAVRTIAQLKDVLLRLVGVCDQMGQLVQEDGFTPRSRAVMSEGGDEFADLSSVAAGTARALKRFAQTQDE